MNKMKRKAFNLKPSKAKLCLLFNIKALNI